MVRFDVPYANVYGQPYNPQDNRYEAEAAVRQRQRDAYTRPAYYGRNQQYKREDRHVRPRRKSNAPDNKNDQSDDSRPRRRESTFDDDSHGRSRHPRRQSKVDDDKVARPRPQSEVDRMVGGYNGVVRSRMGRYLDASSNAVLAAAAGAGIGAFVTGGFGDRNHHRKTDESDKWKRIGGALLGGVVANAGVHKWHEYANGKDEQGSRGRRESDRKGRGKTAKVR